MKIKLAKKDDEIITKILIDENKEVDFKNLIMIDYLYNNKDKKIEFDFDDSINNDEKNKILKLFKDIESIINDNK